MVRLWDRLLLAAKKFWVYYCVPVRVLKLPTGEPVRVWLHFTGTVQNVGFRYEMSEVAKKLALTGYAKNLPDGSVEAEVQGAQPRVDYLVEHMKVLRRASVSAVERRPLPQKPGERGFESL